MPGDQEGFHLDVTDGEHITILQQMARVVDIDLWEGVTAEEHLPADLTGKVTVLDFADMQGGVREESVAVPFQRAHMVRILVGNQHVFDIRGIDVQPGHFLGQTVIVVSRVYHDGGAVPGVEEDIGDPFADAGNVPVDAARIQGLEDLLAAIDARHGFLLELRCFSGHRVSFLFQTMVQTHAASADAAGKMTRSFNSWLFRLNPYVLPSNTLSTSG